MKISELKAMLANRMARKEVYSAPTYWNAKAAEMEGNATSMWPNNNLNELYHREGMALLRDMLPDLQGKRVLDVGCGTGRLSRYLATQGAVVTGIDFAEQALTVARRQSPSGNPAYICQSVFDVDFKDEYDVIVVRACLTVACKERSDLLRALRRLCGALRSNGTIVLVEPIHDSFLHRALKLDRASFIDVMKEAGFKINRVRALYFWPVRLLLAYFTIPAWITTPIYRLGQWLMAALGGEILGDYTAVRAVRD